MSSLVSDDRLQIRGRIVPNTKSTYMMVDVHDAEDLNTDRSADEAGDI